MLVAFSADLRTVRCSTFDMAYLSFLAHNAFARASTVHNDLRCVHTFKASRGKDEMQSCRHVSRHELYFGLLLKPCP